MLKHASELSVISPALLEAIDAIKVIPTATSSIDYGATRTAPETLRTLWAALRLFDPDCSYTEWFDLAAIVFNETMGSDDGYTLWDSWSSTGQKYRGQRETCRQWKSLRLDHPRQLKMGTLVYRVKAKGYDWLAIVSEAEDPFQVIDGEGQ